MWRQAISILVIAAFITALTSGVAILDTEQIRHHADPYASERPFSRAACSSLACVLAEGGDRIGRIVACHHVEQESSIRYERAIGPTCLGLAIRDHALAC